MILLQSDHPDVFMYNFKHQQQEFASYIFGNSIISNNFKTTNIFDIKMYLIQLVRMVVSLRASSYNLSYNHSQFKQQRICLETRTFDRKQQQLKIVKEKAYRSPLDSHSSGVVGGTCRKVRNPYRPTTQTNPQGDNLP